MEDQDQALKRKIPHATGTPVVTFKPHGVHGKANGIEEDAIPTSPPPNRSLGQENFSQIRGGMIMKLLETHYREFIFQMS